MTTTPMSFEGEAASQGKDGMVLAEPCPDWPPYTKAVGAGTMVQYVAARFNGRVWRQPPVRMPDRVCTWIEIPVRRTLPPSRKLMKWQHKRPEAWDS